MQHRQPVAGRTAQAVGREPKLDADIGLGDDAVAQHVPVPHRVAGTGHRKRLALEVGEQALMQRAAGKGMSQTRCRLAFPFTTEWLISALAQSHFCRAVAIRHQLCEREVQFHGNPELGKEGKPEGLRRRGIHQRAGLRKLTRACLPGGLRPSLNIYADR